MPQKLKKVNASMGKMPKTENIMLTLRKLAGIMFSGKKQGTVRQSNR
jgi:hypothetical protein